MIDTIVVQNLRTQKDRIFYNSVRHTIDHLQNFLVNEPPACISKEKITDSRSAYKLCKNMELLDKEEFRILILDTLNQFQRIETISIGTVNSDLVSPREVYRTALLYDAVNIIGVHNHPSGSAEPSEPDIKITKDLCKAGKLVNIKLLDHLVIGNHCYSSFADLGLLPRESKNDTGVIG
ncbi:MAG: hypothetical protein A2231_11380 [Candidatus Firestonebacteria bacterium RIFOXYA2_FULL_40_8]|nr:MAG: hypothetical protein A2231_11380 [Candidatus Firestonebacteria bacterium RIFOXYA2_FULL_40_8]